MAQPPLARLLEGIALDRARIIAPFVFIGILVALVVSEPVGVPLAKPVIVWNVFALTGLAILTLVLRTQRIEARWGHHALTSLWLTPVIGTLLSATFTDLSRMLPVILVEILCAAILLQRRVVIIMLVGIDIACAALVTSRDIAGLELYGMTLLLAQIFTVLFQRLQRDSIVRADEHRAFQERSAQALATQVARLEKSEQERTKLQDQLVHAQRMEAAGTLAAGLAHDMNNILASITSLASLLRDDLRDDRSAADLDRIIKQASRGAELTRALVAFSRRGQYRKALVSLDDLAREVVPILARTLPKSIAMRAFATESLHVEGDPAQLHQIIVNLAVNAVDAMNGKGTLEITTTRTRFDHGAPHGLLPGEYACLQVRDEGCGMDESTRQRAFEPFFTTKPIGEGTGLGLSMVWGIVQAHGGAVTVSSALGVGTTFTIYLPLAKPVSRAHATPLPAIPLPRCTTVLVVDDEDAVRDSTILLLQRRGLDAVGARNGVEALAVFGARSADIGLVILDMAMPEMGGAECFRELRKVSDTPVLIATGYASDAEAQSLTSQGAGLIEKPFAARDLFAQIGLLIPASDLKAAG